MAKMIAGGLADKVVLEQTKQFYFFEPDNIPPPVIMVQHVSFRYNANSVAHSISQPLEYNFVLALDLPGP